MSGWHVEYTRAAAKDIRRLHEPVKSHVYQALAKVSSNPLPFTEGGYGKPLGNKAGNNLTGLLKVKLRGDGIRIVYRLERVEQTMLVIVVSVRDDNAVYDEAARRIGGQRR
ncbi:Cytotoxic translational repressor of toxin-antitoxin stability system [Bifidobacterium saguini DSM 23967]|uniref:Cytotoxic translational repressor of toxin-antitoxin stability system n=1 Tax=Bifidobacterium saguini DSM 23967 TaxID=1437607 RepID=A0A087DCG9_9BIFI|nr:toxin RelE [Bifidobacterium saguini]KFI93219.1 Cytotoxic translational repressor of toxin-antitoxin stability system [Bifidobacterium saguini DSM 23967]